MARFSNPNSPKFVGVNSGYKPARGRYSVSTTASSDDVADPDKLLQTINALHKRVGDLERIAPPEFIEFERDCNTSGTVTCYHKFGSPVRYSVVHWKAFTGGQMPALSVNEALSDSNTLSLTSAIKGRVIIRVEKAQQSPTSGGFGT